MSSAASAGRQAWALALLSALAFALAVPGGFLWDDRVLIESNAEIQSLASWPLWFTHHFFDVGQEGAGLRYYRPIVTASYALDWRVGSGSPAVFHLTNLALHAAAAVLAWRALLRWTGAPWLGALGALFFAWHPSKAESVAWISGRTDVLCLAALLAALELGGRRRADPARRGRWLALELGALAVAYGSKEQAVVFPALVAAEVWAERGRPPLDRSVLAAMARGAAPHLAVAVGYLGARALVSPLRSELALDPGTRAQLVLESAGRYAALALAPLEPSAQHALVRSAGGAPLHSGGWVAAGAAAVVATIALGWAARARAPGVTVGLGLAAALLVPASNLVPSGMYTLVSERFLYGPTLGLALALVSALAALRAPWLRPATAGSAILVAACGWAAASRARDFGDARRFWERELALHPESFVALGELARLDHEAGEIRGALARTVAAAAIVTRDFRHTGLEAQLAVAGAQLVLRLTPDRDTAALEALDAFLARAAAERAGDAVLELRGARLVLALGHPPNRERLARELPLLLGLRAEIASRRGADEDATRLAREAARACPGCVESGSFAAIALARAGLYEESVRLLDELARHTASPRLTRAREAVLAARELAAQAGAAPDGPPRLTLRAEELSRLEAWGRAYDVLRPHHESIRHAPGVVLGYAELAYRAGDEATAVELVRGTVPPEAREALVAGWAAKMGWEGAGGAGGAPREGDGGR